MTERPLTERDLEVLGALDAANRDRLAHGIEDGWAKPMDCGAWDASYHSGVLKKLARCGLVDVRSPSVKHPGRSKYPRAGCWYKINVQGKAKLP